MRETDSNGEGTAGFVVKSNYSLDAHGHVILTVTETDYGIEGVPNGIERRSYTYNRRGDVISSTTEFLDDVGSVDAITRASYEYDPHGNLVRTVEEDDSNMDGIVDAIRTTTRTWVRASAAR